MMFTIPKCTIQYAVFSTSTVLHIRRLCLVLEHFITPTGGPIPISTHCSVPPPPQPLATTNLRLCEFPCISYRFHAVICM